MKKGSNSGNRLQPSLSCYAVNVQGELVKKEKTTRRLIRNMHRVYTHTASLPAVLIFCFLGITLADLLILLRIIDLLIYLFTNSDALSEQTDVYVLFTAFIHCSLALSVFATICRWFIGNNPTNKQSGQSNSVIWGLSDQESCFRPVEKMRP